MMTFTHRQKGGSGQKEESMEVVGAALGAVLGLLALWILLAALFIWIGAKMAFIEKSSFARAVLAAVACGTSSFVLSGMLLAIPVIGPVLGQIIGILLSLIIIKAIFETSFGKAFLAWVFQIFAVIVAFVIGFLTFGAALLALFER
jgi:hypothetical protein